MKAALEFRGGVPVLVIDGRATAAMMTWGRSSEQLAETARYMRAHGFRLYSTPLKMPWPRPGEPYDFQPAQRELEALLRNDPKALYMPRIDVEPPDWWKQEHPEEMAVWENAQRDRLVSVASQRWLQEACTHIKAWVEFLESGWDRHIFAYHAAAQHTGEWYYTSTIWHCNGWGLRHFEEPFAEGFRRWLGGRYKDIGALNEAWGSAYGDFSQVPVPSAAQRRRTAHGLLRDPVGERAVIDLAAFQSQAIAQAVKAIARAFKDACQWRKLVYIFYGYTFELAGLQEGASQFGHLGLDGLLNDEAIDAFCAPLSYLDRGLGGSQPIMGPTDSVAARSKAWCNEDDTRTHLGKREFWGPETCGRVQTPEQTFWLHQRNFMASLVHRSQMWFMDLQGEGWLQDDGIWANLADLRGIYEQVIADPRPLRSDVAVVVDEAAMEQIAYGIELGLPLLYDLRLEFGRMGTTPELWLLADYLQGRGNGKKLVIFPNAFSLNASQRAALTQRLAREASTAVWFYAPGVLDPAARSAEAACNERNIEELTGIRVLRRPGEQSPAMRCVADHPFAAGISPQADVAPDDIVKNWPRRDESFQFRQMTFPPRQALGPLFAVGDAEAEVFARYADSGEPAAAFKRNGGFNSVFVGGLTLPARMLANIASRAGVHLYCAAGDVIHTDGTFLSITACSQGSKTIHLPKRCRVRDALSGAKVARGSSFRVELLLGETRIYKLIP